MTASQSVIVYVDAAYERHRRRVGAFGKIITSNTGRWQIGVVAESVSRIFLNGQLGEIETYEAEAWANLKGFEFAREMHPEAKEIVIRGDSQVAWVSRSERATQYMTVLRRLADQAGVTVRLEYVPGRENPADEVSRRDAGAEPEAPRSAEEEQQSRERAAAVNASADEALDRRKAARKAIAANPELAAALRKLKLPKRLTPEVGRAPAISYADDKVRAVVSKLPMEGLTLRDLVELQKVV